MLWICGTFDSRQNSGGNSAAFLPGFTGIQCGALTGYPPGFEASRNDFNMAGLYSKLVPIVPVLVESWSGQVNSGPW